MGIWEWGLEIYPGSIFRTSLHPMPCTGKWPFTQTPNPRTGERPFALTPDFPHHPTTQLPSHPSTQLRFYPSPSHSNLPPSTLPFGNAFR